MIYKSWYGKALSQNIKHPIIVLSSIVRPKIDFMPKHCMTVPSSTKLIPRQEINRFAQAMNILPSPTSHQGLQLNVDVGLFPWPRNVSPVAIKAMKLA